MQKGSHHSLEAKNKMSKIRKGRKLSDEHIINRTKSQKGLKRSEETKNKISESRKGKSYPHRGVHFSKETKNKISNSCKGLRRSEETKSKMSKSRMGRYVSEETRKKISNSNKGKIVNKGIDHPNYGKTGELSPCWKGGGIISRKRTYEKHKNNIKYRLGRLISCAIWHSLKRNNGSKNGRHWCDLVGYSVEQLENRLKSTLPKGYTWQDFIEGRLQIDHIVPINAFNYSSPEHLDFRNCWTLNNLQLLPSKTNICKSDNLKEPFQPCLKLII